MDKIQREIIENTERFRPKPKYPTYPSYHVGLYLEDLFFEHFINSNYNNNIYYIPIFWTSVYNDGVGGVQDYLNTLDKDLKYFTVSQHDDAVKEKLPVNTNVYSAGGNNGNTPIPLVCSKIPNNFISEILPKTKLASFVGSMTHPIRNNIFHHFHHDKDFSFKTKNWTQHINENEFQTFVNETKSSKFTLCPRGYGKTSFRLYETFQLNSVPVYISDNFWLPYTDEINWDEFCVLVHQNEIHNIKNILLSIDDKKYNSMLEKGKLIWSKYFEINKTCEQILNKI